MQDLRIGIAGYGVVGKRRRHFIDLHPRLYTVAVCDRVFESHGVLPDGVRFYPDYRSLLSEGLDALFVCMTNDMAAEVTMAGLERGLHVFCEKPPGRNIDDVAAVVRCERRHPSLKLKYGFNHRYHDSVRDALALVRSRELGPVINLRGVYGKSKIISFESDWRTRRALAGGGILLDQGIHIHSFVSNGHWHHDVEDNAYAIMRTADGVVAMLHSSATQWRHRFTLEITLSRGMIILSGILSGSKSYGAETITVARVGGDDAGDPLETTVRYNADTSWRDEIAEFAEAIIDDRPIVDGAAIEALRTMQLVYRIYCADPDWKRQFGLNAVVPEDIG
jgi:predicted dehydrogenase